MGASVSILDESHLQELFASLRARYLTSTDLEARELYGTIQKAFVDSLMRANCPLSEEEAFTLFEKRVRADDFLNIEELDLSDAQLTTLPAVVTCISKLHGLYLEDNFLRTLPIQITEIQDLRELYVRNNELEVLPNHINNLPHLEGLYLDENHLSEGSFPDHLPPTLLGLTLQHNHLQTIPACVFTATLLEELSFDYNEIQILPCPDLAGLRNLRDLSISFNQLTELPSCLSELVSLTILRAGNNQIASIPKEIKRFVHTFFLFTHVLLFSPHIDASAFQDFICKTIELKGYQAVSVLCLPFKFSTSKTITLARSVQN